MRAIVQRVLKAQVSLQDEGNRVVGAIERGITAFVGVGTDDAEEDAARLAQKIARLRIFDDENGKMNLDLSQVGGRALVVSQFTLYADCAKGNRPSFVEAAPPEKGERLFRLFVDELKKLGVSTEEGVFRSNMAVSLVNDGPVTIWLDTTVWRKKNK